MENENVQTFSTKLQDSLVKLLSESDLVLTSFKIEIEAVWDKNFDGDKNFDYEILIRTISDQ